MTDHADRTDATSVKVVEALGDIWAIRKDAHDAFDTIERNDLGIKGIVDGHVQALYKSKDETQKQMDSGLREHVHSEIRRLQQIVQALSASGGASGPKGPPDNSAGLLWPHVSSRSGRTCAACTPRFRA